MAKWLDKYQDGGDLNGWGYDTTGRNYSPAWGGQFQDGGNLPEVTVYGHKNPGAKAYFDRLRKNAEDYQDREAYLPMAEYLTAEKLYSKYGAPKINMIDKDSRPYYNPITDTINIVNPEDDYNNTFLGEMSHKIQANNKGRLGFTKDLIKKDLLNTLKNISIGDIFDGSAWKNAYENNYYTEDSLENDAHEKIYPKLKDEFTDVSLKEWNKMVHGKKYAVGGSMPGAVGFTYARETGSAPANGKYTKKTKASAQNGKSVYKADSKDKKLYGAKDEDNVKQWFNDYYNSDFFKTNLHNSSGLFGMKDESSQVSKNTLKSLDDTEIRYNGKVNNVPQRTYGDYNHVFMGDPNLYYNQPTSEVFAHELAHINQNDILAQQPRNVMLMLNKNKLTNRQSEANQLFDDLMKLVPRNIDDTPKFKSRSDFTKHTLGEFISDEAADSQSGSHDSTVPEIRADIMALRELSAKKGIWDAVKNKPGSFTPEMLNKLYQTKELNVPMQYTDKQGTRTLVYPSDESKKKGNIEKVDSPKNPGLMLERLRRRFKDSDLLFLMNNLAKNEDNASLDQAQNGKEMKFYQDGLDWKPKSISKNGSVIKDDRGQWAHPGKITEIGSNQITMKGVDYPVLGISDMGDIKMMEPGKDYKFKGTKVTEYPQGGWLNKYK